jgi:hypothetical protein
MLYGGEISGDGLREAVHRTRVAKAEHLIRVHLDRLQRLLAPNLTISTKKKSQSYKAH